MFPNHRLLAIAALLTYPLLPVVLGAQVQKTGLTLPTDAAKNRADVVTMFTKSYGKYKEVAFGHDDLQPVSGTFNDNRNGWGATIVDAMSTMAVMGLDDLFQEAVNFSSQIDFSRSKTSDTVSVFETTIRYLGGLLSAYELSDQKFPALLQKAKEVADKMTHAWVGNNQIPYGHIDFSTNLPQVQNSNIAEAGTLTLEWSILSKHTGDNKYRELAEKAARHIAGLSAPLPGLPAQGINPTTGEPVGGYVTWGGGSDSYFEYLIKYARLSGSTDPLFVDSWRTAVDSSMKTLAKHSTVGNHLYLADFTDDKQIRYISSHLACFHGGNWLFGGKLLNNDTIVNMGLELVDACWNTYESTATKIGPEVFAWVSPDGNFTGGGATTPADDSFYAQHGFYVYPGASDYILRPEVLESNFYAWRVTGDTKYLDRAASAIASMNSFLAVNDAFAGIQDVRVINSDKIDDTESFFFAEVLKYLYLTFDDPEHISLNKYVFNTEAHPFIAPLEPTDMHATPSHAPPKPFHVIPGPLPAVSPNSLLPDGLLSILHL